MRIAHVVSGIDRQAGGVTAAVIGLAAAQARAGLRVSVLSNYFAGVDLGGADELRAAGVTVDLVGPAYRRLMTWHPGNRPAADRAVANADVVHVHALWEDVQHQTMRAARRRGVPYVVSPHGMLSGWSMRQKSPKKKLYLALRLRGNLDAAAAIHFTTNEEAREVRPLALRPPPIVEALGLDLTEFATLPPRGTFRRAWPTLGDRPVVLFMSRLHPKKGLDILVAAFAKADVGDARLVIAGPDDGGYEAVVRGLVDRHGLADRVVFTGMLHGTDRIAALADADVFALSSYQENFGIVVLESLAAGTPVVISDQVNFSEYLAGEGDNHEVGEVVPCDVDRFAAALTRWVGDAGLRTAAGGRARPFAMDRFDWAAIAERWKTHYANVAGRSIHPVPSPGIAGKG